MAETPDPYMVSEFRELVAQGRASVAQSWLSLVIDKAPKIMQTEAGISSDRLPDIGKLSEARDLLRQGREPEMAVQLVDEFFEQLARLEKTVPSMRRSINRRLKR